MRAFFTALQFLTILPAGSKGDVSEKDLSSSIAWFPAVGLIIGVLLALSYFALSYLFPLPVVCAFVLVLSVVITGGLHIDGFIDTVDGIASRADRKRMLEIMREGRPGALGLAAAILLFLSKLSLLLSLPKGTVEVSLVVMSVLSRSSFVAAGLFYPYARDGEGLGKKFLGRAVSRDTVIASLTFIAVIVFVFRLKTLILLAVVSAVFFAFNAYFMKKLGGLTGDTMGAVGEVMEVIALALAVVLI
jgi:adenosylcobinamide-GDP ribazoletransferase